MYIMSPDYIFRMSHSSANSRPQCMSELTSFYYDAASSLSGQKTRMLNKDRMESFSRAIYRNKHLFKGKIVLEVGCGLGLLSLFAAKAGAKRVLAIELPGLAEQTEKVVRSNTSRIEVVQGTVTDVTLPVTSVDIIISDWMGPCLLHESLLQAVIQARDLWLVPGSLLLPD